MNIEQWRVLVPSYYEAQVRIHCDIPLYSENCKHPSLAHPMDIKYYTGT